jgi:uncharacterized protein (TIGR02266 family)
MADTRKDRRAPVSLKVRFKSATVDEFIEHYCKDVSRGGIFIKSSQPMAIGTLLKFQFQLKDESSLIKGVGRVVWTRSPEDAVADQPAGMGIKFIKMDNDSKAIVERIVDSHGDDGGAFDQGRATASNQETPSERPHASTDNFFPEIEPAELPPPEDRTAVRQAAQFLAAALAEGGTDQAAKREAEQKAAEARQRTAQIEAQRMSATQARDGAKTIPAPEATPLPSMIIDPSLGPAEEKKASLPASLPPAPEALEASLERGSISTPAPGRSPTTSFPPASEASLKPIAAASSSLPSEPVPSSQPPSRKSPLPWAAVLVGLVAVAAWVALKEKPREVDAPLPAQTEQAVQAPEPDPEPPLPEAPPEPAAAEADSEVAAAAEPAEADAAAAEPVAELKLITFDVKGVTPPDPELLVNGESRGKAPLKLELPEGVLARITARAPGFAENTQEITPASGQKTVRFVLTPLPFVVYVETTPPGAKLSVGARRGVSPGEIVLGPAFRGMLGVTARLPGYEAANAPLRVEDFAQTSDNMRASVNLTLTPLPPAPTPPVAKPKPRVVPPAAPAPAAQPEAAPKEPEPGPDAAPAPAPEKPAEPAPSAPAPAATPTAPDRLPSNPFN